MEAAGTGGRTIAAITYGEPLALSLSGTWRCFCVSGQRNFCTLCHMSMTEQLRCLARVSHALFSHNLLQGCIR